VEVNTGVGVNVEVGNWVGVAVGMPGFAVERVGRGEAVAVAVEVSTAATAVWVS
jgi:hypothetical protein